MRTVTFGLTILLFTLSLQGCGSKLPQDELIMNDDIILSSIQIDDAGRVLSYEWKDENRTFTTKPER